MQRGIVANKIFICSRKFLFLLKFQHALLRWTTLQQENGFCGMNGLVIILSTYTIESVLNYAWKWIIILLLIREMYEKFRFAWELKYKKNIYTMNIIFFTFLFIFSIFFLFMTLIYSEVYFIIHYLSISLVKFLFFKNVIYFLTLFQIIRLE